MQAFCRPRPKCRAIDRLRNYLMEFYFSLSVRLWEFSVMTPSWGDHAPLPDPLTYACQEASVAAMARVLDGDPHDGLAAALGRLGRAVMGAKA